jgi:hypothetical protein
MQSYRTFSLVFAINVDAVSTTSCFTILAYQLNKQQGAKLKRKVY